MSLIRDCFLINDVFIFGIIPLITTLHVINCPPVADPLPPPSEIIHDQPLKSGGDDNDDVQDLLPVVRYGLHHSEHHYNSHDNVRSLSRSPNHLLLKLQL